MAKLRVYELARELDLESAEVLERAKELGLEVTTASSGLEADEADLVRLSYEAADGPPAVAPKPEEEIRADTPEVEAVPAEPDQEPAGEEEPAEEEPAEVPVLEVWPGISAAGIAEEIGEPPAAVAEALMSLGEMVSQAQSVPEEALPLLAEHFGYRLEVGEAPEPEAPAVEPEPEHEDRPEDLAPRSPVVTVMGHVDHGKTQLLDTIRQTNVVAGEAGGITQHIGAYQVELEGGRKITFIDTPGHEAFTTLRARGAHVTDIVILVVAADDGVMPQTVEAISHAKAAGVPIIVAINKMDLPDADPHRVRAQLTEYELVAEELGGDTITLELSALDGDGVDELLEMIGLVAEVEDFRANPDAPASGVVIESELDVGRGPLGTVIVRRGTLRQGDALVAGTVSGRARALLNEQGDQKKEALPGTPVQVMGWDDVPTSGDRFEVVEDDKEARRIAAERQEQERSRELTVPTAQERLTDLLEHLREGEEVELRLVLKADAHGSLEAIRDGVAKIERQGEAHTTVIHAAVGGISENDVMLAEASDAVVLGFNVRPDAKTRRAAEDKGVVIQTYRVIYELLEDVEKMLLAQMAPAREEVILGVAEVRATFRAPRYGQVAGCYVTEGEIARGSRARLVRDGVVVYDGVIGSLRRFKDDVRTVSTGFECGVGLENFSDVKEGDVIEVYEVREVARV